MPVPQIGDVCSGPAVHLGVPVALVRIVVACPNVVGTGIDVYLRLWVSVPEDNPERTDNGTPSPGLV